jgi:hypothetical protein
MVKTWGYNAPFIFMEKIFNTSSIILKIIAIPERIVALLVANTYKA